MIYVEQMCFDKKRPQARLLKESEAKARGYYDGYNESFPDRDVYVDAFEDADEAVVFMRQCINA